MPTKLVPPRSEFSRARIKRWRMKWPGIRDINPKLRNNFQSSPTKWRDDTGRKIDYVVKERIRIVFTFMSSFASSSVVMWLIIVPVGLISSWLKLMFRTDLHVWILRCFVELKPLSSLCCKLLLPRDCHPFRVARASKGSIVSSSTDSSWSPFQVLWSDRLHHLWLVRFDEIIPRL